jgi:transposase InsO family protein
MSQRKYRTLFSLDRQRKPGPKGPSTELIHAVVEMKERNPNWGCPRMAQQIALAFNIQIDKDVIRRILAHLYRPGRGFPGPSWLTFLGHMKDSLWSMDLFRCESATLRPHWVLLVMDEFTRRIIGFGVHAGTVDGVALCRMFNRAIRGHLRMSKYLSSDNDPLYRFHQWQANLRILEVTQIKSIPYVSLSHPFVERLIGSIRREYLDHTLLTGRAPARYCRATTDPKSPLVSMAISLSILIRPQWLPDEEMGSLRYPVNPFKNLEMKSSRVCVLSCGAFHGSDCFTAPYQFATHRVLQQPLAMSRLEDGYRTNFAESPEVPIWEVSECGFGDS